MAQETVIKLIDDIDNGKADETVRFGLDGAEYEIDLSAKNAAKLRELLEPYIESGRRRRSGRVATAVRRRPGRTTTDREQNRAIREWAKSKRKKISDRGRIPEDIVAEYHASAGR